MRRSSSPNTYEKGCKLNNGFKNHCFQKISINVQLLKTKQNKNKKLQQNSRHHQEANAKQEQGFSYQQYQMDDSNKKITTLGGRHLLQFSDKLSSPKTSNFGNNRRPYHRHGVLMMTTFSSGWSISHLSFSISPSLA